MEKVWEFVEPAVLAVQHQLGLSRPQTELMLLSIIAVILVHAVASVLFPSKPAKPECCISKFIQQRKAVGGPVSIPPNMGSGNGGDSALLAEIHQQLAHIHNEIQQLKNEREIVDHELIETSTQILQAIGASFVPIEDEEDSEFIAESPAAIIKPVPTRPLPVNPAGAPNAMHAAPINPVAQSEPTMVRAPAPLAAVRTPVMAQSDPASIRGPAPVASIDSASMRGPAPVASVRTPVNPQSDSATMRGPAPVASVRTPVNPQSDQATMRGPAPVASVRTPVNPQSDSATLRGPAPVASVRTPVNSQPDSALVRTPVQDPVQASAVNQGQDSGRGELDAVAKAPIAVTTSTPPSEPVTAAPKMSALAMARMKREQEMSEAAKPAAPAVGNPFSKPKSGPFGGPIAQK